MSTTLEPTEADSQSYSLSSGVEGAPPWGEPLSLLASQPSAWRPSAPKRAHAELTSPASPWANYLSKRHSPRPLSEMCEDESPLRWGLPEGPWDPATEALLEAAEVAAAKVGNPLSNKQQQQLQHAADAWTRQAEQHDQGIELAIGALALVHLLADGRVDWDNAAWWRTMDVAAGIAARAADWRSDADLPAEATLAQQLLAGELPLTLSYLFPEIKPLHAMRKCARQRLSDGLDDLLNGEGLWHGSLRPVVRPLIACWTRCRAMGATFKKGAWTDEAELQFEMLATSALQWTACDGSQLLAGGTAETSFAEHTKWTPGFLRTLLRLAGDAADKAAARELLGNKLVGTGKLNPRAAQPEPAENCEWAGLALLRTSWDRKGATLAVDYAGSQVQLELTVGGRKVLAGAWQSTTVIDGKTIQQVGDWEEVCWVSDDDVDYLELSIDLAGGGVIERQILLAHDEDFVFLADNVKSERGSRIEHRWQTPLDERIDFAAEPETAEAVLSSTKPVARVFPLGLPEWRVDSSGGRLSDDDGALAIEQRQPGAAMSTPLAIDFRARRVAKPCTWRQLTVAESLEIVGRDVAVGYRMQCGKDQFVFYRSLATPANRTVIGQNLAGECFFGKLVVPEGDVEELLEVEA